MRFQNSPFPFLGYRRAAAAGGTGRAAAGGGVFKSAFPCSRREQTWMGQAGSSARLVAAVVQQ